MTLAKLSNSFFPSIPSLIDKMFDGDLMDWTNLNFAGSNSTLPAVNVKENENEYQIEVAAPGMKREDFKIQVDNNRLIISSESREERTNGENEQYSRREFSYQSFQRTFTLPESIVDSNQIQAKYTEGILRITLPKKEEAKPKPVKEIAIA